MENRRPFQPLPRSSRRTSATRSPKTSSTSLLAALPGYCREQRQLYTLLLLNLDALSRAIKTPLAADPELRAGTVSDAVGIAVGNVHHSYYTVYLAGSPDILPLAETAWQAAWHIHDWTATGHPNATQAIVELEVLRGRLNAAAEAFADAVRKETAG